MKVLPPLYVDGLEVPGLYLFEGAKACFLLNRESGTGMMLDRELAEQMEAGVPSGELLGKLVSRGMTNAGLAAVCDRGVRPDFFLIDMTQACNFACGYCLRNPESEGKRISSEMLEHILDKMIAYCKAHGVTHISIQPWGGEPLLELDKVLYIREKMNRDAPWLDVNISIETNGSRITADAAKRLRDANIGIGVSIDGPREIHDSQRRDVGDHATFDQVMEGIQRLRENGVKHIGSISVITKPGLEHIDEILDFFAEELPDLSVKINPMHSPGRREALPLAVGAEDISVLVEKTAGKLKKLWLQGRKVKEGNFTSALQNLLARSDANICKSHGCMGGRRMLIFDQNGDMFPCEIVDYPSEKLGNAEDGVDIMDSVQTGIGKKEYFKEKHKAECDCCPWWYYCQGGCTSAILYERGCVEGVDECGCASAKALYEQAIRLITDAPELAAEMAGIRQYAGLTVEPGAARKGKQ